MSRRSDVCLVLEGTYPYISGGVSSWVHQLICALKDIRFSLLILLPNREHIREMKYKLPSNVVDIRQVFIHEHDLGKQSANSSRAKQKLFDELEEYAKELIAGNTTVFEKIQTLFDTDRPAHLTIHDLLFSLPSWDMLRNMYKHYNLNISFLDFFWTFRFSILPVIPLFQTDIPDAEIYHTVSTGYAGLIGAVAKIKNNAVLLLTEHGIYAKERKMEIAQASWIYDEKQADSRPQKNMSFFKEWWITMFNRMARLCYEHSRQVVTLYEDNRKLQIAAGAAPDSSIIIPNGIDVSKFSPIERTIEYGQTRFTIGFVGRVVPIKDVKTFIKACKIIVEKFPESKILILGPTDEEEQYYEECVRLCAMLDLNDNITFTGIVPVKEYYPLIDLVVLTSESEAQPLVILEANAMGIPIVSSDVGACDEMLNGRTSEDKSLGASGLITGVANPRETAQSVIKILSDPPMYHAMSKAGIQRVYRFYNQDDLFANYLNLYEKYLY
ncbi:MAG: GT4 family glycosyltransferase PelF [Candidatus Auribacterota bacterium]|jgi:glycosyltransferase involved in cell wall biosynthesis|nr:GT4 family glycosyltransferase PelF [Candidatus Auribacterota bacterium]